VVVPGRLFQPSLMFVRKTVAYPSDAPYKCLDLTYIEVTSKSLSGRNTLAYQAHFLSYEEKICCEYGPWECIHNT
jgi:hypothetical protein